MVLTDVQRLIWERRYRDADETSIDQTWARVASAAAAAEPDATEREGWRRRFHELLASMTFLPGGRILAGAGTSRRVTLFNCFVMGPVEDSMEGICRALEEGSVTM